MQVSAFSWLAEYLCGGMSDHITGAYSILEGNGVNTCVHMVEMYLNKQFSHLA